MAENNNKQDKKAAKASTITVHVHLTRAGAADARAAATSP